MERTKKLPRKREYNTIVDECTTNTKRRAKGKVRMGREDKKRDRKDRTLDGIIWGLRFCRARLKGV